MEKEAQARLKINALLTQAGWKLIDDTKGKASVTVENHLATASTQENGLMGDDFEHVSGFAD